MAKHTKGKKISLGNQRSCRKLAKQPGKAQVGNDNNAIREAFMNTPMTDSVRFSRMGAIIIRAAQTPVKRTADAIKGWSAKLSFRTFNALKEQGVLS
jgi:hypothetical protein